MAGMIGPIFTGSLLNCGLNLATNPLFGVLGAHSVRELASLAYRSSSGHPASSLGWSEGSSNPPSSAHALEFSRGLQSATARRVYQPRSTEFRPPSSLIKQTTIVNKRSTDVLHDPWFNKGCAFSLAERNRLSVRGLVPPKVFTEGQQVERFSQEFWQYQGVAGSELKQWRHLNRLHDNDSALYYKFVMDNIKKLFPIIYTPTIGEVCQKYSGLYRRPRGMYFSAKDKGEMAAMVWNWPAKEVDLVVVSDGSRVLGLGDLGIQGIGVVTGKADLYVAGGGFNPRRVLPVMIDVGTNNEELLKDPYYLGLLQKRLQGEEYLAVMDEFMAAVSNRWPNAIVQFEDFENQWADLLLQRYRNSYRMANDDIQCTASVSLAGVLGALKSQGLEASELPKQRFVIVGTGNAGMGVTKMISDYMANVLGGGPKAAAQAARQFWLVDLGGLITTGRQPMEDAWKPFARPVGEGGLKEGAALLDVVKAAKPDFLLGLAGSPGVFTPEVLKVLAEKPRPAVFAMSNPTSMAEATAEQVFRYTEGKALFASGSPFRDVILDEGQLCLTNQVNNMFVFPGLGLGTMLSGARHITDHMLLAAAESLVDLVPREDARRGILVPPIDAIRAISREVAVAVITSALKDGVAEGHDECSVADLKAMSEEELTSWVASKQWMPTYTPMVYRNPLD